MILRALNQIFSFVNMSRHIFSRYFHLIKYDTSVNPIDRLWATDNVYEGKDGKKKFSKLFFRSTTENLKCQLLKMSLESRNVYEFVIEGQPTRLFFDIESEKTFDVDVNRIIRHAFAFTKHLGWNVKFHVYQLDATNDKKFSRHGIIKMIQEDGTELWFKDVCSVGAFVRRCFARLPEEEDPLLESIDFGVYTNNREFRIGGSGKNGGGRYLCFMKGSQILSPEDTLKTFETFLVQDHSLKDQQIIEVAEENGLTNQSRNLTIAEYRQLWIPQQGDENIPLSDLTDVIKDRKRKLKLDQERASRVSPPEKRQRTSTSSTSTCLLPSESMFYQPKGYDIAEPMDFFGELPTIMGTDNKYSVTEFLDQNDLMTVPYSQISLNFNSMKRDQKIMLACIQANIHKKAKLSAAERAACDFIGTNTKTSKTLAELCAIWLMELTLDTHVTLVRTLYSDDNMETGFIFSCPRTLLCHKKGAEHKNNKIFFVFDVLNATATQQCHDTQDCGSKQGVQIILPLKIRYMMFLAKTWRELYLQTFF